MSDRPFVQIHADESCLGNQFKTKASPGGAGALVETWRGGEWIRRDLFISEPDTTNNRMAIRSAIESLGALTKPCRVVFVSDSTYLVKGASEWMPGWKKRGWKRKAGPIENLELWQALDRILPRHEIDWRWVKGHAGHPRNEYANDLAVMAAEEQANSAGLTESGFQTWLDEQREKRGRYMDFMEFTPPNAAG